MLNMRDFTSLDWDSFSGAEKPASGAEPQIVYLPSDVDAGVVVIADAKGIEVLLYDDAGDVQLSCRKSCPWPDSRILATALPRQLDELATWVNDPQNGYVQF
jgi:hypothetical protein